MRRYPHALICLALAVLPGTAHAAQPKQVPTCNLLVDALHDTVPFDAPHLDIRSGDVASGDTTVAGVLRLRDLAPAATATLAGGRWDLSFGIDGARYTFVLRMDATGAVQPAFLRDAGDGPMPAGPVTVTMNLVTGTITWTVPRANVAELPPTPAGDVLAGLAATTYVGVTGSTADSALSARTYTDGWPSCVRP